MSDDKEIKQNEEVDATPSIPPQPEIPGQPKVPTPPTPPEPPRDNSVVNLPYGPNLEATNQVPKPETQPQVKVETSPSPNVPPASSVPPVASNVPPVVPKSKKPKKKHPVLLATLFGILGGILSAVLVVTFAMSRLTSHSTGSAASSQKITINSSNVDASTAEAVSKKCLPSVASITMTSSSGTGVGSGVVLDKDGNILTNYHVVEGAKTLSVSIGDKTYEATVVGTDPSSDLAVIKITPEKDELTPITQGDSSKLAVGEWVMSIGSPFGLDQSVSQGIVSSLYRKTMLQGSTGNTIYTNLIQTDAAINPGNSGGALVNANGELVGINSIIESSSGSSSGVGFAIPSNYALKVAKTLIEGGTVEHAYLGVTVSSITPLAAQLNKLSVNQGAYVQSATDGTPAASAGLKKGDIITKIDDTEITSGDELILAIRSHEVGDKVKITFIRDGKETSSDVTLGSDANADTKSEDSGKNGYNQNQNQNENGQSPDLNGDNGSGMSNEDLEELLRNLENRFNNNR